MALRRDEGRLWIGIARAALLARGAPGRAMLVVDDGRYWFERRAVCVRGRMVEATGPRPGASPDLAWFTRSESSETS